MSHLAIDSRRNLIGTAMLASAAVFGLTPIAARSASEPSATPTKVAERASDSGRADSSTGSNHRAAMIAPAEAAQRAARKYGGRVLNVVLEDGPGGPYYRVKLLDGGRMRVVRVEARQ